jgi:hypothetical protein
MTKQAQDPNFPDDKGEVPHLPYGGGPPHRDPLLGRISWILLLLWGLTVAAGSNRYYGPRDFIAYVLDGIFVSAFVSSIVAVARPKSRTDTASAALAVSILLLLLYSCVFLCAVSEYGISWIWKMGRP